MIKDAEAHAEEDASVARRPMSRNQAESLVYPDREVRQGAARSRGRSKVPEDTFDQGRCGDRRGQEGARGHRHRRDQVRDGEAWASNRRPGPGIYEATHPRRLPARTDGAGSAGSSQDDVVDAEVVGR